MKRGSILLILRNYVAEALAEWSKKDPALFHGVFARREAQQQVANISKAREAFYAEVERQALKDEAS
jgi:hypothetical protein